MDYKQLAVAIIENIGGKSNVKSVVHCATRLRFTLNDATLADTEKISSLKGVLKVVNAGGQYQIVIGTDVPQVYQEVVSAGGFEASGAVKDDEAEKEDKRSPSFQALRVYSKYFPADYPCHNGSRSSEGGYGTLLNLRVVKKRYTDLYYSQRHVRCSLLFPAYSAGSILCKEIQM